MDINPNNVNVGVLAAILFTFLTYGCYSFFFGACRKEKQTRESSAQRVQVQPSLATSTPSAATAPQVKTESQV